MQYNKRCPQKMTQMVMDWQDPDLASKAHEIMLQAVEATQKNASKMRKLQKKADYLQSRSEEGRFREMGQGGLRQAWMLPSNLCGAPTAYRGAWWRWRTDQCQLA